MSLLETSVGKKRIPKVNSVIYSALVDHFTLLQYEKLLKSDNILLFLNLLLTPEEFVTFRFYLEARDATDWGSHSLTTIIDYRDQNNQDYFYYFDFIFMS